MRITSRAKAIAFFITLGSCLVGLAIYLNIVWLVHNWRNVVPLVLGIIFFANSSAQLDQRDTTFGDYRTKKE